MLLLRPVSSLHICKFVLCFTSAAFTVGCAFAPTQQLGVGCPGGCVGQPGFAGTYRHADPSRAQRFGVRLYPGTHPLGGVCAKLLLVLVQT